MLSPGGRVMNLSDVVDAGWRAESASVTASQTFGGSTLSPKTLAVIVKAPRELLEDAVNANEVIAQQFALGFAQELDRAIGYGSGTGEPTGIANTRNVIQVASAANGTALTDYSKFTEAQYQLGLKGVTPNGVVMSPREFKKISDFADTTGQPLRRPDSLASMPFYSCGLAPINQTQGTSSVASTMLVGDFSKCVVAARTAIRIEVAKDRYADTLEYAFVAYLRADVAVTQPKAFAKITGIIP